MIRIRGLRHAYPGGRPLAFPDVEVAQGDCLLVRGNSGAGKSTWLALVAGLLTPTSGEIVVAEQPLAGLSPPQRDAWRARHLALLPQRLHLSDALTVQENLALAYFAAGLPRDAGAITGVLQRLGVADLAGRKPASLSVGQAQRVALARAVLMRPAVLLADEPTASLDDESAAQALRLLQDSARDFGATLVIATHDQRVASSMPDAAVYRLGPAVEAA